jgi:hypothetical protein
VVFIWLFERVAGTINTTQAFWSACANDEKISHPPSGQEDTPLRHTDHTADTETNGFEEEEEELICHKTTTHLNEIDIPDRRSVVYDRTKWSRMSNDIGI